MRKVGCWAELPSTPPPLFTWKRLELTLEKLDNTRLQLCGFSTDTLGERVGRQVCDTQQDVSLCAESRQTMGRRSRGEAANGSCNADPRHAGDSSANTKHRSRDVACLRDRRSAGQGT